MIPLHFRPSSGRDAAPVSVLSAQFASPTAVVSAVPGLSPSAKDSLTCIFKSSTTPTDDLVCTCSLLPGGEQLLVVSQLGDVFEVALPCRVATVRALANGLLLERMPFAEEVGDVFPEASTVSPNSSVFFRRDGKMPRDVDVAAHAVKMPTLFSLVHPFEEPKPLVHARATLGLDDSGLSGKFLPSLTSSLPPVYVTDHCERVLTCDWRRNVLVTFHVLTRRHSLWCLEAQEAKSTVSTHVIAGDIALRRVWTDSRQRLGTVPASNVFVWESSGEGGLSFTLCLQTASVLHTLDVKLGGDCRLPHPTPHPVMLDDDSGDSDVDLGTLSADAAVDSHGFAVTLSTLYPACSSTVVCIPFGGVLPSPSVTKSRRWLLLLAQPDHHWQLVDGSGCVIAVRPSAEEGVGIGPFLPTVDMPTDGLRSVPPTVECESLSDGAVLCTQKDPLFVASSPWVSQCFLALDAAMDRQDSLRFRADFSVLLRSLACGPTCDPITVQCDETCVSVSKSTFGCSEVFAWMTLWSLYASRIQLARVQPISLSSSPWDQLLGSAFHNEFTKKYGHVLGHVLPQAGPVPSLGSSLPNTVVHVPLVVDVPTLHRCWSAASIAFHWVWNDVSLDTTRGSDVLLLGNLIVSLLHLCPDAAPGVVTLKARYKRFGCSVLPSFAHMNPSFSLTYMQPFTRCTFVLDELRAVVCSEPFSSELNECVGAFRVACPRLSSVVAVYMEWLRCDRMPSHSIVTVMASHGMALPTLSTLPCGVALPLHDVLHAVKANPPIPWPPACYALIDRHDLVRMFSSGGDRARCVDGSGTGSDGQPGFQDADGFEAVITAASTRFGRDKRVSEVSKLLCSSQPVPLAVDAVAGDHDAAQSQQTKLLLLSRRLCGVTVGRGMLTLASIGSPLTDHVVFPPIVLAARLDPSGVVVTLDATSFPNAAQVTVWPEFHNGVAAALRVQPGSNALTRTWINSHKPETPSHRHGGFLLGLGLTGCLSQLTTPDLFELLQVGHDGTTIGVVLGLAACNLGTADVSTSKLLRLHVPAVLPVALSDIDLSPLVQAASLAGLGLVYAGTSNRMFVEFMLAQLGGRPVSERLDDRDAYCLCAGYALGWIALRRGGSMTDASLHDIGIESKLQRYMNGGPSFDVDAALVDPARSCRIKEGGDINVAVTAAGATVALGLMYLQTNDASAAKLLSLPNTLFGLDGIRSDVMILRVVCHSVVMWDAIDATPHWIHSNIPSCVADVFERVLMKAKKDNVTLADLMASDAAAASDESTLHSIQDAMTDVTSVKEYHALSLAGACLAVGLKFAGTHDVLARETLLSTLAYFRTLRATFPDDDSKPAPSADIGCPPEEQLRPAVAAAIAPDRFTVEMCLCTVANALAVVMAGSGDVACLRVLRDVRERCDRAVSYGSHMGLGMAIGLLFLGGGQCSLSRSPMAIASLLCALHPRWPSSATDNAYHPQALRHLYVLAADRRVVTAKDVETLAEVHVPIAVVCSDGVSKRLAVPCLLPELHAVDAIAVVGERYWPYCIRGDMCRDREPNQRGLFRQPVVLWVQRKRGQFPYKTDPHGKLRLLSGAMPHSGHEFQANLVFREVADADRCDDADGIGDAAFALSLSSPVSLFASSDPVAMLNDALSRAHGNDSVIHASLLHGLVMEDKDWAVRLLAAVSQQRVLTTAHPLIAASLNVFVQYLLRHCAALPRELGQRLQSAVDTTIKRVPGLDMRAYLTDGEPAGWALEWFGFPTLHTLVPSASADVRSLSRRQVLQELARLPNGAAAESNTPREMTSKSSKGMESKSPLRASLSHEGSSEKQKKAKLFATMFSNVENAANRRSSGGKGPGGMDMKPTVVAGVCVEPLASPVHRSPPSRSNDDTDSGSDMEADEMPAFVAKIVPTKHPVVDSPVSRRSGDGSALLSPKSVRSRASSKQSEGMSPVASTTAAGSESHDHPPGSGESVDSAKLDGAISMVRAILRDCTRQAVVLRALMLPQLPLKVSCWLWFRHKLGCRHYATESMAACLARVDEHANLIDVNDSGCLLTDQALLATLFQVLYSADITRPADSLAWAVLLDTLDACHRWKDACGKKLSATVEMSQADARACIQKGLSSITPQLDIVDALVLESVAVSVRCLPRPADGFVTETALYWTLYHAMLQFAASSDQMLSLRKLEENDRIADVDFNEVFLAADAMVEADERAAVFVANLQTGRSTMSRKRLGHVLRKCGLVSSKGGLKRVDQRVGPFRSSNTEELIQLKFAHDTLKAGVDEVLDALRTVKAEDTAKDVVMIDRIRLRMLQLMTHGIDGSVAWELFRTVLSAVDTLKEDIVDSPAPPSPQPQAEQVQPHQLEEQVHPQPQPVSITPQEDPPATKLRLVVDTSSPQPPHRSGSRSSRRHRSGHGRRSARSNMRTETQDPLAALKSHLAYSSVRTKQDIDNAMKALERITKHLKASTPSKSHRRRHAEKDKAAHRLRLLQQRMDVLERYAYRDVNPPRRSVCGLKGRKAKQHAREVDLTTPTAFEDGTRRSPLHGFVQSIVSSVHRARSTTPTSAGTHPRVGSPAHFASYGLVECPSPTVRSRSPSTSRKKSPRRSKRQGRSAKKMLPRAGSFEAAKALEIVSDRLPTQAHGWSHDDVKPPLHFSAEELSLLEAIAQRQVKSLQSCAALRKESSSKRRSSSSSRASVDAKVVPVDGESKQAETGDKQPTTRSYFRTLISNIYSSDGGDA